MGDTQLPDTAQAVRVAESFARIGRCSWSSARPEARRSRSRPRRFAGAGSRTSRVRPRATDSHDVRHAARVLLPHRPERRSAGGEGGRVHARHRCARPGSSSSTRRTATASASPTAVVRLLGAAGINAQRESVNEATVTDFSSLIARIPNDTQVVYVPWQLAAKAQLLGQQLRASGRNATLFGGDGLYSPDDFKIPGSFVTAFPVAANSSSRQGLRRAVRAAARATCSASRRASRSRSRLAPSRRRARTAMRHGRRCRRFVNLTNIPAAQSLLGFPIRFQQTRQGLLGPGDMRTPAAYIVYRINAERPVS